MLVDKEAKSLGMPWEQQYGYARSVKVGDTIWISGQVSHDDKANIVGVRDMEVQMRQTYANVQQVLAQYGTTMANLASRLSEVDDRD
jgi:2-iminobutanoate/2-iminopropanoate deaminase